MQFTNPAQRKAVFARMASVSSLSPEDAELKDMLDGRYMSLADRYKVPEQTLSQHSAFGIDVDGVLVTKNFVPKFRVFQPDDYFSDVSKSSLYITNYRDLPIDEFNKKLKAIQRRAGGLRFKIESTEDPLGFQWRVNHEDA